MIDTNEPPRPLSIATCPVNWNNNDLTDWRPVTPFPAILDRMRDAGYTATEYDGMFGTDAGVVRNELQSRGMALTGSYRWIDFLAHGGDMSSDIGLESALRFLAEVDCRNLIVSDVLRPHRVALAGRVATDGSDSLDAASYERIADGIHAVARLADGFGIRVRYHNHVGSWIEAPHELDALLHHLDPDRADLCFDTGHYAYGGGNPYWFIRENISRIGYLHLKDVDSAAVVDARSRELTFLEALRGFIFSPVGTGTANISSILSILVEHRFKGWVVVEQDTCEGDPTDAARHNLAFISQWMNANYPVRR